VANTNLVLYSTSNGIHLSIYDTEMSPFLKVKINCLCCMILKSLELQWLRYMLYTYLLFGIPMKLQREMNITWAPCLFIFFGDMRRKEGRESTFHIFPILPIHDRVHHCTNINITHSLFTTIWSMQDNTCFYNKI
jgi:hypothetical protein